MQTFEEALRDGVEEFLEESQANDHTLALGRNHVFAVGYHPVEAAAARYFVLERWPVDDENHIVARTPREAGFGLVGHLAIGHEVVTFLAHDFVGAEAARHYIVAGTAHQGFVAPKRAAFIAAEDYVFASPT